MITKQPQDMYTLKDIAVTFRIEGDNILSCSWQMSRDEGIHWSTLSRRVYGSSPHITFSDPQSSWNGRLFRCVVKFNDGTIETSDSAKLYVMTGNDLAPIEYDYDSTILGTEFQISVPNGSLPFSSNIQINKISNDDTNLNAILDYFGHLINYNSNTDDILCAYDIIINKDNKEIQPENPIFINFPSSFINTSHFSVLHVNVHNNQLNLDRKKMKAEKIKLTQMYNFIT